MAFESVSAALSKIVDTLSDVFMFFVDFAMAHKGLAIGIIIFLLVIRFINKSVNKRR